jgi:hypothetical protein
MKKILFLLFALLITFSSALAQRKSSSDVYVRGYTRKDGTVVPGHYRSAPNSTNRDNFSTRGNTNPYTSKKGWVDPDKKTYITNSSNYSSSSYSSSSGYSSSSNKNNSSSNKVPTNFAKPLRSQGESYFYALDKRYVGLDKPLAFFGKPHDNSALVKINIGIEENGGGLVQIRSDEWSYYLNNAIHSGDGFIVGKLVFYLENGETVTCFDKKVRRYVNGIFYSYYKLTRNEVHLLEEFNVDRVQFTKSNLGNIEGYRYKSFMYNFVSYRSESTKDKVSSLFGPYWEKRDD